MRAACPGRNISPSPGPAICCSSVRKRTIKPEFWTHPVLSRQDDTTRLVALGIINMADDEGYFLASPDIVRSAIWPFEGDGANHKATNSMSTLVDSEFVIIRTHPTHGLIGFIPKFSTHQEITKPKQSLLKQYFGELMLINVPPEDPQPPKPRRKEPEPDGAWLQGLKNDPIYEHIDVGLEFGKCGQWCQVNNKTLSRRRFVNWLNNVLDRRPRTQTPPPTSYCP